MLSALPATSFYLFCLANSHSSFGSRHQRHFLCEGLLSRPPSRNPPVKRSHRSLFLSFVSHVVWFIIGPLFVGFFD